MGRNPKSIFVRKYGMKVAGPIIDEGWLAWLHVSRIVADQHTTEEPDKGEVVTGDRYFVTNKPQVDHHEL